MKYDKHVIKLGSDYAPSGVCLWAMEHPLKEKDVYENNAYDIKHRCEKDLEIYVSQDDIANAYSGLGYKVEIIISNEYADGYCWEIGRKTK